MLIYSVPCRSRLDQFADICVPCWHFLRLLLQSLDLFVAVEFVLNRSCALLLSHYLGLLCWVIELDFHLIHLWHRRLVRRRVGWSVWLHLNLLCSEHWLGLNHVVLLHLVHEGHLLLVLMLTQVYFYARLWVANRIRGIRAAFVRAQVRSLHGRRPWLVLDLCNSRPSLIILLALLFIVLVLLLDNFIGDR